MGNDTILADLVACILVGSAATMALTRLVGLRWLDKSERRDRMGPQDEPGGRAGQEACYTRWPVESSLMFGRAYDQLTNSVKQPGDAKRATGLRRVK